jgi:hypothetical protein
MKAQTRLLKVMRGVMGLERPNHHLFTGENSSSERHALYFFVADDVLATKRHQRLAGG